MDVLLTVRPLNTDSSKVGPQFHVLDLLVQQIPKSCLSWGLQNLEAKIQVIWLKSTFNQGLLEGMAVAQVKHTTEVQRSLSSTRPSEVWLPAKSPSLLTIT